MPRVSGFSRILIEGLSEMPKSTPSTPRFDDDRTDGCFLFVGRMGIYAIRGDQAHFHAPPSQPRVATPRTSPGPLAVKIIRLTHTGWRHPRVAQKCSHCLLVLYKQARHGLLGPCLPPPPPPTPTASRSLASTPAASLLAHIILAHSSICTN